MRNLERFTLSSDAVCGALQPHREHRIQNEALFHHLAQVSRKG